MSRLTDGPLPGWTTIPRHRLRKRALGLCLLGLLLAGAYPTVAAGGEILPDYVPGEIIIKFRPAAKRADQAAILEALGATTLREFDLLDASCQRISGLAVPDAIRRFASHPAIAYIEPNYIIPLCERPDDPLYGEQWGVANVGQTGGMSGADVRGEHAWDVATTSRSILVAIIDSGGGSGSSRPQGQPVPQYGRDSRKRYRR
ncbi:MAG: hypothetical protein ABIF77_11585 [bacterium]